MNKITVVGNLTNKPELKTVKIKGVDTHVVNFSVAVNERGRTEATYFRVHAWRGLADVCAEYLDKGRKVLISGPVHLDSYKDTSNAIRTAMEIRADEVEFLSPKPAATVQEVLAESEIQAIEEVPGELEYEEFPY